MKLTTIRVGIPVYGLKAAVTHSIVRKPTVFERMVMRLSRRGAENDAVGSATIREAFEQRLGVQGIPQLLERTVSGLIRLEVLRAESTSGASLLDQPIRTLRLTAAGEDFYNRNTLPSSPTRDHVAYWYTPWSTSLVSSRPGRLTAIAPETSFDEDLLRPRDASSLVRRELEANKPRFLKRDSRIVDVEADIDEDVNWRVIDLELHASDGGYLDLKVPENKSLGDWLVKLEPGILQDTFLDGLIGRSSLAGHELPSDVLTHVSRLALKGSEPASSALTVVEIPELMDKGVTIHLTMGEGQVGWTQDEAGRASVVCPRPAAVPPPLVSVTLEAGRPRRCNVDGDLVLTWSGGLRYARVLAELEGQAANGYWKPFSDELAAQLAASHDPTIATVPFAWGSDHPIEGLRWRLAGLSLSRLLETAGAFIRAAKVARRGLRHEQIEALVSVVITSIDASQVTQKLGMQEVERWVRSVKDALGNDVPLEALTRSLLAVTAPPSSALEARVLLNLAEKPDLLPVEMLGPSVLAMILEDLWRDPSGELRAGDADGLRPLEAFRAAQADLDTTLGRQHARSPHAGQRVTAAKAVGHALRVAEHWLGVVDDPALSQAVGGVLPAGLLQLRDAVRAWAAAAAANVVQVPEAGFEALVFDANTLMDHPNAIRNLAGTAIGVIPNRVLQELDGLKRSSDEATARKARAANRTLDELNEQHTLRFEPSRIALIPPDLGSTDEPDNQILSVAIAYSRGRVTLITGDKNLRNKAEASSISAKDWLSLQESRGQRR